MRLQAKVGPNIARQIEWNRQRTHSLTYSTHAHSHARGDSDAAHTHDTTENKKVDISEKRAAKHHTATDIDTEVRSTYASHRVQICVSHKIANEAKERRKKSNWFQYKSYRWVRVECCETTVWCASQFCPFSLLRIRQVIRGISERACAYCKCVAENKKNQPAAATNFGACLPFKSMWSEANTRSSTETPNHFSFFSCHSLRCASCTCTAFFVKLVAIWFRASNEKNKKSAKLAMLNGIPAFRLCASVCSCASRHIHIECMLPVGLPVNNCQ